VLEFSDYISHLETAIASVPVLPQKQLKRCHISFVDHPEPIGAVEYQGGYFAYVKFFADENSARRAVDRMLEKGNQVILTRAPKGLVLWVYEPDAHLAR
jgi:hypothetical protein